ncbi:MAG: HAD-IA family hydrolase [bacterium]
MNDAATHAATDAATHALFDVDGLLLDTERIYTEITQRIVGRYGKTFEWSVKGNMIGRPSLDAARYLVEALALPLRAEDYLAERDALLRAAFPACDALPGAEALVRHLHRNGVPMAVATSSARDLYDLKVSRHRGWFDLFDAVVTGDDPAVARGKPAPDIFLAAAERIGAPARATLVFEDSPSGLAAGVAAEMRVIAVPDANMDNARYAQADWIIPSLRAFDPRKYGLAPME